MWWIEAILLGGALAMDAFGVSVTLGVVEKTRYDRGKMLLSSALFGLFQFLMPLGGFFGGTLFCELLQQYGRIIAAALLIGIGAKMIHDRNEKESVSCSLWALLFLALATSIDALFVGVGFACVGCCHLFLECTIIGVVTFLIAMLGAITGKQSGKHISPATAMVIGGSVLILLGIKTLF